MVKSGKKYHVGIDALKLTEAQKQEMPLWLHPGAKKELKKKHNTKTAKCLRNTHNVTTVGDAMEICNLNNHKHSNRRDCVRCESCRETRQRTDGKCVNPHGCWKTAKELINTLLPKWKPGIRINPGGNIIGLTAEQTQHNAENQDILNEDEGLFFNPSLTIEGNHISLMRVFRNPKTTSNIPATHARAPTEAANATIYTNGSCTKNGDKDAAAGAGVWFGPHDERNSSIRIGGT